MAEDFDNSDLSKIEILRGKTPGDIKQKCLDLCRDYLAGVWLKVDIDQIQVKRLNGAYTNQLYYCAISKPFQSINDEPQEVIIRLYGGKHFNNFDCGQYERLTDVIIALLVSENKLGPKIYGIFEGGQIQHYYKHKQFRVDEQNDPKLVEELSRKLAHIHALDVSIKKTGNWIFETFDNFYKLANERFDLKEEFDKYKCETFKRYDLKQEIDWLNERVLETNSPIHFCHNDFRGSNIMVTETDNKNTESKGKIVFCDFEYSSYGFRGADFGTIFAEWGKTWADFLKLHNFPDDSLIKPFIATYIEESVKIHGKQFSDNKLNSIEQILREVKVFALVSNMFIMTLILKSDEAIDGTPFTRSQTMRICETCYKNYHQLKQKFIGEKVF